ncbi:hypothetical protein SBP17_07895 [Bifidobacterium thermophilum]|nr:hypothetical protein [Bifidobacterium thermophilum]MDW8486916.1 hypothetical protein [Bifidobacterium thermophilum]
MVGSRTIEWFTAEIIAGLNDVLRDAGYDLVVYPIEGLEARDAFFEKLPVRSNADAVFVSAPQKSPSSASIPPARDSMRRSASMTKRASN